MLKILNSLDKGASLVVGLTAGVLLITGCASMSADECVTADWHAIGFEDGSSGRTTGNISRHRKACAKHGVTPDFNAYTAGHAKGVPLYCVETKGFYVGSKGGAFPSVCAGAKYPGFEKGYERGLTAYCSPNKAFAIGSANGSYPEKCPALKFPDFEEAYEIGLRAYEMQLEINALQEEYNAVDSELVGIKARIASNEQEIIARNSTPERRRELIELNKDLRLVAKGLEVELSDLFYEIESKKRKKDAIRF